MGVAYSIALDLRPAPGAAADPEHYDRMVELVRVAEAVGCRTVWASEQHGVDDGYLPAPFVALAALARETTRIRLGSGVIVLPLTHPRRVAEEAGLLDVLSGGRVTVGVGAGHHAHEFDAFDRRLDERGPRMEAGMTLLKAALAGRPVPDGLPLNVLPVQRRVPLIGGGLARPAVDRAVRLADGHFSYSMIDPQVELPTLWRELLEPALDRHDRDRAGFHLICSSIVWPSDDFEREWRDHVGPAFRYQQRRYYEWAGAGEADLPAFLRRSSWDMGEVRDRMLVGPPSEVAQRIAAIRADLPIDELVLLPALPGVPFELAEQVVRTFASEVAPAIAER